VGVYFIIDKRIVVFIAAKNKAAEKIIKSTILMASVSSVCLLNSLALRFKINCMVF
jgi:hypothetical protein